MSNITFPIGRLVWGSLYEPQTKDFDGNPLLIKEGPDAGKPTQRYSFGVAIPKGSAQEHWANTAWGQAVLTVGNSFPGGAAQRNDFSWKIIDGDSTQAKKGKSTPINTLPGHAGHWVLSFSSSFPPKLYKDNGAAQLIEPGFIKTGYYIQVAGSVAINENKNNPGVYLNHNMVCFQAYGEEIQVGADPMAAGFGGALPAGATQAPVGGSFAPAGFTGTAPMPPVPGAAAPVATPPAPAAPAPAVSTPPPLPAPAAPAAPAPRTLVAVPGAAYTIEQCRQGGWTDDQIVQSGYATWSAPAPAAGVAPVPSFLNGPA